MKISWFHISKSSVLLLGLLLALPAFASAGTRPGADPIPDIAKFDIAGYRLYMTEEEALKVSPSLKIEGIKVKGDLIGYKAKEGPITIYFTADELGKKVFRIERLTIFQDVPDVSQIMDGLVKQYGRPNAMGRVMLHSQACWGKCLGKAIKLYLKIRLVQITNNPYPVTLQLLDVKMEDANKIAFLKRTGRE